jgi:hypothetical protein
MKYIYPNNHPHTQAWWDWASDQLTRALIHDPRISTAVSILTEPGRVLRLELDDAAAGAFMAWAITCPQWRFIAAIGVQPVYKLDPTFEDYLRNGQSLLDVLARGVGGKDPARVWIAAGVDGPYHTYVDPGLAGIGGVVVPFSALKDGTAIFAPKKEEVVCFLMSLGFPKINAEHIVSAYPVRP